jgi:hypothetical protein
VTGANAEIIARTHVQGRIGIYSDFAGAALP